MAGSSPQLHIVAGPNGAGKTTFARRFLPTFAGVTQFINTDLIAAGLSPFEPGRVALAAGRLALNEIRRLASERADFAFETTLSGRTYEPMLREFREAGYSLQLYYLGLPAVNPALARVRDRVQHGGNDVPAEDVRRRYERGPRNFFHIYRSLCDSWTLFDNS